MASTTADALGAEGKKADVDHVDSPTNDATDAAANKDGSSEGSEEDEDAQIWDFGTEKRLVTGQWADSAPPKEGEEESRPFDVVQVHGLYGSKNTTWGRDGANWVSGKLHDDYPRSRILYCDYLSDQPRISVFTMEGLREHALEILNDLLIYREDMDLTKDNIRPIVFIAHDIGGIIVKLALWIALVEYGKYRNVIDSVRTLIFFGCPHRSTSTVALEDMVSNLLHSSPAALQPHAADNVKSLTRAIIDVNGYFEITNLASLLEIFNIYSTASVKSQQVFDKYTATFGLPFEEVVPSDAIHADLAKAPDVAQFGPAIDRSLANYPGKPDDNSLESMRVFHNAAPTASLIRPFPSLDKRFDWIVQHDAFKNWLSSYGTDLLYIHGRTRLSEASAQVTQALDDINTAKEKKADMFFAFTFDKYNDERNTIVSFLTAFLAQILRHRQSMTDFPIIEQLHYFRSWSQTELFLLFRTALNHNDHEGIVVVIDGIDQCDDSSIIFLQDLSRVLSNTEHRIKILITGFTGHKSGNFLTSYPSIGLDDHSDTHNEKYDLADAHQEYLYLLEHNSVFARYQPELRNLLAPIASDKQLLRLVSNHVLKNPRLITHKEHRSTFIKKTPSTVRDICLRVVQSVPSQRQAWARKAILYILLSFRPLKTWELNTALSIEFEDSYGTGDGIDEFERSTIVEDIESLFQGLFTIRSHSLYPAHPEVRSFFLSANNGAEWYGNIDTGHRECVGISLEYFTLPQVQKTIAQRYLHQPVKGQEGVFPENFDDHFYTGQNNYHRYSFCSYATKYWVKHYHLIPASSSRSRLAKTYLGNNRTLRAFAEAQWWIENPVRRRSRSFFSPLPLLAHLGVHDLLDVSQDTDVTTRGLALTEAARNGHIDIVRLLMQFDDYEEYELEATLNTASTSENEQLLVELVEWMTKLISARRQKSNAAANPQDSQKTEDSKPEFPFPNSNILCRAITFSFERLARLVLKLGADIQCTTVQNYTPLDFAVRQRNPNILSLVIKNKAELGLNKTLSYHPMHLAVIYGMPEMVQQLVDAGVDLNLKNTSDSTATYLGAWHRHYRAIEPIVKAGADLHNDTTGIWTPLTCCARRDTRKAAEILLKNGAKVDVIGFNEWTPLRSASVQGYVEFCKLLLENKADPNNRSGAKGAPIMCEVARQGNFELVKLLVEYGADVKAVDYNKSSAMLNAAVTGKTEVAEYLIDNGADLLEEDVTGFNGVALAAYSSYPKTIEMLAKRGIDIHRPTKTTWTPIHYAYDNAEVARVLMELGADINKVAEFYTPLILAATFNKPETARMLLKYKPNLEVPYDNPDLNPGLTALGIAVTNGYAEIARDLLEAGANINHQSTNGSFCLEYPVRDNNLSLLKMLLEYHPDQTLFDKQGNTALHCVVGATEFEIAKALVNAGAPLDIRNKRGYTPLGEAICESHLEITKYLISKGAEINDVGGEIGGPMHTAARNCSFEFLTTLVDAGGDVNILDPCLGTPVQAACTRWTVNEDLSEQELREKIVRYLIEEKNADLTIEGGDYACALNAICAFSTPETVKLALEREVKVSVPDRMGRQAIHLSAARSIHNFLPIHAAGGDIEARDKAGRTVLHWATIGGNVDVIERVLSLSRNQLDVKDKDGWTPLLWACRGAGIATNPRSIVVQKAVVSLLLKRGADPTIVAQGGGGSRSWSPLSVSRFNGGESVEGYIAWLIAALKEKAGPNFNENAEVHKSKKGKVHSPYCDSCLMTVVGLRYRCKQCLNHDFCTKCYQSIKSIHYSDHEFTEDGPEWDEDEEKKTEGEKKDDEDSSEDSDEEKEGEGTKNGERKDGEGSQVAKEEGQERRGRQESVDEDTDTDDDTDDDE